MVLKKSQILPPPLPFPSLKIKDEIGLESRRPRKLRKKDRNFEFDDSEIGDVDLKDIHDDRDFMESLNVTLPIEGEIPAVASVDEKKEIENAIKAAKKKNWISWLRGFLAVKNSRPSVKLKRELVYSIDGAKEKIRECEDMLFDFNLEGARISYFELIKVYNRLSFDEKNRIYEDVCEIYSKRKDAERLGR